MDGLRNVRLHDKDWGEVLLLICLPKRGNIWGVLEPLRDTSWGRQVSVVSGEAISHALHGYAVPLMREVQRKPRDLARRLTVEERMCNLAQNGECGLASEKCQPGSGKIPFCYEAPVEQELKRLIDSVVRAWDEGRYVIVVDGKEFSF